MFPPPSDFVAAFAGTRAQVAAKTPLGNLHLPGTVRHPQAAIVAPECRELPFRITDQNAGNEA
jgi:hypothetical protein